MNIFHIHMILNIFTVVVSMCLVVLFGFKASAHPYSIHVLYISLHLTTIHVGIYTSPMDGTGYQQYPPGN